MEVDLILLKNGDPRKSFSLPSSVTVVGRRQDCDLCVPLMVISRRHCQMTMEEDMLNIRDLGSRNGTFVNGERIDETSLYAGDEIEIGPLKFVVQVDGVPQEASIKGLSEEENVSKGTSRSEVSTDDADILAGSVDVSSDMNNTEIIGIPAEEATGQKN